MYILKKVNNDALKLQIEEQADVILTCKHWAGGCKKITFLNVGVPDVQARQRVFSIRVQGRQLDLDRDPLQKYGFATINFTAQTSAPPLACACVVAGAGISM